VHESLFGAQLTIGHDMDKDVARQVIRVAFRCAGELQGLLEPLKERCSPDEYRGYARGIASAIDGISVALTNKILAQHPDLAGEIEANLERSDSAM
jgi:hypothetical protein